jgi:hypothetical protein
VLTIRLTTVSGRRLPHASRRIWRRALWHGALLCMFLLAGVLLTLHFSLHTYGDFDDVSHQCPASHINVVHTGLRDAQSAVDRVVPDAACAAAITLEPAAPRYFDEASVRAPVSAHYTSILSARGPPALL